MSASAVVTLPPTKNTVPRAIPPLYEPRRGTSEVAALPGPPAGMPLLRWDLREGLRPDRDPASISVPAKPLGLVGEDLHEPLVWARNMARVIFDILAGRRNPATIRRWLDPHLFRRLEARAQTMPDQSASSFPTKVQSAKGYYVNDSVVEATILVSDHQRYRAVAMRLELFRGRWKITALEIG